MKKENKRLAQELRAQKRAKEAKRAKIKSTLKIWGPVTGVVLVFIFVIVVIAVSGSNTDNGAADDNAIADSPGENSLNTQLNPDILNNEGETQLNTEAGLVVENGDRINLDYVGYVDGEEFEGGNTFGMGTELLIGSGQYIDGFEEGIIGHSVGETFDLNLTFPDYYHEELAGRDVVFTTTINGIYE